MAKKAAELDSTEFDVVFNAAHMLRLVFVTVKDQHCGFRKAVNSVNSPSCHLIPFIK